MKILNTWNKICNLSLWVLLICIGALRYFKDFFRPTLDFIIFLGTLALLIYIISIVALYILSKKVKKFEIILSNEKKSNGEEGILKNKIQLFKNCELAVTLFFIVSIILEPVNKDFLQSYIPQNLIDYIFWLGVGLYLGFQLCKILARKIYEE